MFFFILFTFYIQLTILNYALITFLTHTYKKKCVYILRGLPGSGKSSYIDSICDDINHGEDYIICNYQNHFNPNNPRDIPKSYNLCFNQFIEYLEYDDIKTIFIDNPNIERWEYQNYIDLAKLYGLEIKIVEIECPDINYVEYFWSRCTSKINLDNMKSMWNRWEIYSDDEKELEYINLDPFVEIEISSQGDSLPYPVKSEKDLNKEIEMYTLEKKKNN